jgi:hypothetical protein
VGRDDDDPRARARVPGRFAARSGRIGDGDGGIAASGEAAASARGTES